MPLTTAPNIIELSDFSKGLHFDVEATAVPPNGVLRALNLLPEAGSGTLKVRKGFKRFSGLLTQGYRILTLVPFNRVSGTTTGTYLMAVISNGSAGTANNVQVWKIRLDNGNTSRVDTPGRVWNNTNGRHWGATINGRYYGGGLGDKMYSWDPDGGWDADPSIQNWKTWKGALVASNLGTQYPGDYAFKVGQQVLYDDGVNGPRAFSADKDNRFKPWKLDEDYAKGDKVSLKNTHPTSGLTYLRSYKCTKKHTTVAGNKPGAGTGVWDRLQLGLPVDDDGDIGKDWNLIPGAGQTNVGVWHADRLWLRYDTVGEVGKTRIQYSAPSKPAKGSDIGQLQWDAKDWRVGAIKEGEGGGWLPDQPDIVTGLCSFGYYLILFMRNRTKVLAGTNENTWVLRDLATDVGCMSPRGFTQHEGLVYFLADKGLFQTDGTVAQPVPGSERLREWLREAVNFVDDAGHETDVQLWSYGGYLWMAIPTSADRDPDMVIVYDTNTESFWRLDLPVMTAAVNRISGVEQMFFSQPDKIGDTVANTYNWTSTRGRSSSTRFNGVTTETNLCTNPSFWPTLFKVVPPEGDFMPSVAQFITWENWSRTSGSAVKLHVSHHEKRSGMSAVMVKNISGIQMEGIANHVADTDGTSHVASFYVKPAWKHKHKRIGYNYVRFRINGNDQDQAKHNYNYVGHGWWRVDCTYDGSTVARDHSIVVRTDTEFYIDCVLFEKGTLRPYFDGEGGMDTGFHTVRSDQPFVYQYDHPAIVDDPSDDTGRTVYDANNIPWAMQTAWMPFGVLREERRVRRVWSLIRGKDINVAVRGHRNYEQSVVFDSEREADDTGPVKYAEGLKMPDAYALSISLEGLGSPAAILGVGVETQPRRVRYHH